MPDLVEKAGRTEQMELFVAPEKNAQQSVETDKVVHMGMRDKDMGNPQNLARRKRSDVAEIKQDGTALEEKIHKYSRITKRPIYEDWMELRLH